MKLRGSMKRLRRAIRAVQRAHQGKHRRKMLGEHVVAVLMRTGNGIFAVDIEDDIVRPRPGGHRTHGEEEIARAAAFLDDQANVLVVGSHIGTIAIPLARGCKALWAIEPNPNTFELLTYNVTLNRSNNVTPLNFAASDRDEEIEFVASRTNSGGSKRMPKIRAPIYFRDHPQILRVPAQPLDRALEDVSFKLIFMDCEGSEYLALKGMPRILSGAAALFVEFLPHHLKNVAGVTPEEFVDAIGPGFTRLYVPSKDITVGRDAFKTTLRAMYDADEGDAGLAFSRA
jgi:FkbM family methyltransferase